MCNEIDSDIEKAIRETREKARNERYATVTMYDDLKDEDVNMTHYQDFYEMEQNMQGEAQEKNIVEQLGLHDEKLKETKGKFGGARYCYLGRHAEIRNDADEELINLESALEDLVRLVDNKETVFARQTIQDALLNISGLDSKFLENLTAVRMHALESGKYTVESYKERISINLLLDAAARHFLKYIYISKLDEESGITHLAHIAANLIMIDTQINEWMS